MLDLDDFMPQIAGFDIKQTREIITQTIVDRSISSESRYAVGGTQFRYSAQVNAAFGYAKAYSKTHQAAELSRFFQRKKGRFETFLHTDPVSGIVKGHDFGFCDGDLTDFQLLDLDNNKAEYIQSCELFIDSKVTTLSVAATAHPFYSGCASFPGEGINGVVIQFLPQGSPAPYFNVAPGDEIKLFATGSAVTEFVLGTQSGPGGKYYDYGGSDVWNIPSDCAFKPGVKHFGAIVGVFVDDNNDAFDIIVIGAGGDFTVPAGAHRLYVGLNLYAYGDCTGGFSVSMMQKSPAPVQKSSYSINRFSGAVKFISPPPNGSILSWSGVCAKEVRFDSGMDLSRVMSEIFEGSAEIKLITPPGA